MRIHLFEFAASYMSKHGAALRAKYTNSDAAAFMRDFDITDVMMKDFIAFGESKDVKFNAEEYAADKEWMRASLKAQLGRTLFGNEGQFRAMLEVDPQFEKAISLFPEAKKIAGLH